MKFGALSFAAVAVSFLVSALPANAGTISCGGAVQVTLNTSTTATCNAFGDGNNLDGVNDPLNQLGYVTLDTNSTVGLIPLTISLGNSGSFAFTALSSYTNYVLGLQTSPSAPKPDYFSFNLPSGVVSGTYSINDTGTVAIGAVLYGLAAQVAPVPGPVVGAGLPGILMVLAGVIGWRRRRVAVV